MFIPLKVTTDYSMLQSMITIPKLLLFLKKYDISICGICDKNLFGVMEFYRTLTANNIKPIIGLEVTIDSVSLYFYARNYKGYQALLKINSIVEERELSLIDVEELQNDFNIILPFSFFEHYLKFQEKFAHFYVGYVSEYEMNEALAVTENVVFCPDFKAFSIKDSEYLRLLKAIDLGESLNLIEKTNRAKNSFEYYMNETIDLSKTMSFALECNISIPNDKNYIPKYLKNQDSDAYLVALARKGLEKRMHGNISSLYDARLKYELSVIQKMGFSDYFLIVYDYVKYAKKNGILVGAGRGSAVGSLVSFCLGITDIDPLEYHLLFERFLNPERVTMPDIDIDFEDERRNEVISYVKGRYGKSCVANIMAFGTLKSKLVLRSVGKSFDMNQTLIDSFVSLVDGKLTLQENLQNKDISYYVKNNQDIKKMYSASLKIEGLKKHITTHAAGVVISSVPLDTVIPVHHNGDELLTGVTMNYLEDLGLLKMDFLAINNLTIIKNILKLIEQNTGKTIDLNKIDLHDANVLKQFTEANTVGIFQFDSEGMKNFLRKLKPTKFLDLVSAIALYRPGPMENIDTFIKRKEGREPVVYLHEDLKPILEETYGIIVYQEQIMQILVRIGGFSFAEADIIRRAMSKKKKSVIEESREKLISGAKSLGYPESLALEIFKLILKFANYGFNKSHSVSYAFIAYQMAYLKCYYPIYFITNLLNMSIDSTIKTNEYLALAKRAGITIQPPSINESELAYKISGSSLRLPFLVIKSLGTEAAKAIIKKRKMRPYTDFFDFVSKTYGKNVNKKTIESLISSGAFEEFGQNHNTLKASIDKALNYAALASDLEDDFVMKPTMEELPEETEEERRQEEYQVFGFYITNHPASKYLDPNIMKLEHIKQFYNKHIRCVVLIEKIKEITTKKDELMAFVTASDETDSKNLVVFASNMSSLTNVHIGDLCYVEGRVARRFDEYQINVNKIEKIGK